MAHHAGIKSITGQSNSLRSENGSFARADSKQREVAGAAAEVSDDDEFVMVQRTRIEVSGSDRFILELDRADACLFERPAKPAERKLTVFIVIRIGIADGTADDDGSLERPKLLFGDRAEVSQEDCEQVFNRILPAIDVRTGE